MRSGLFCFLKSAPMGPMTRRLAVIPGRRTLLDLFPIVQGLRQAGLIQTSQPSRLVEPIPSHTVSPAGIPAGIPAATSAEVTAGALRALTADEISQEVSLSSLETEVPASERWLLREE